MTKSIVSGGVVLVAVVVIVLGLFGIYDLSDSALLSWGAVGLIATILFAAFGGFKPFFRTSESDRVSREAGREMRRGVDIHREPAAAEDLEASSTTTSRRLISVGADPDSPPSRPLFEERPPAAEEPPEAESELDDESAPPEDDPPHRPLFGEALGEQLAAERPAVDGPEDGQEPDQGALAHEPESEESSEESDVDTEPIEPEPVEAVNGDGHADGDEPETGIAVDTDPDWVSREVDDGEAPVPGEDVDPASVPDGEEAVADSAARQGEGDDAEASAETPTEREEAVDHDDGTDSADITDLPVVLTPPAAVELHRYSSDEVMAIVRAQEGSLVDSLIDEGLLTTAGPITDRDVRTMIFVAVSSNELIEVLTSGDGETPTSEDSPAELTAGDRDD